jgi:hypothetical protein
MPLKVNVGLSKKIGLPNYGSLGASVYVEYEADSALLRANLDAFQQQVKNAFVACRQAVQDELERERGASFASRPPSSPSHDGDDRHHANGNGRANSQSQGRPRRATASQIRAIEAIAARQHLDLPALLQLRHNTDQLATLSIAEASQLIDEL